MRRNARHSSPEFAAFRECGYTWSVPAVHGAGGVGAVPSASRMPLLSFEVAHGAGGVGAVPSALRTAHGAGGVGAPPSAKTQGAGGVGAVPSAFRITVPFAGTTEVLDFP